MVCSGTRRGGKQECPEAARQPAAMAATGPALLAAPAAPAAAQLPPAAASAGLTFTPPALPLLPPPAGSSLAEGAAVAAEVGVPPMAAAGSQDVARRARGLAEEFFALGDAAELQLSMKVCKNACEP